MMPRGVDIFVALEPVDMRLGFDRLGGMVIERMACMPRSRAIFVFIAKNRQSLKALYWDGTGMVLLYKRLDRGVFEVPRPMSPGDRSVVVTDAVFQSLISGLRTTVH